ncbi:hypothetical protein HMPREF9999_01647 [Alloprevotella sp. oral taxon 473 str. F0040]|nr:hypothetical protein HMPREF9999_01647 [Alloprevotella sp. oral taxon 473 str. F0040]
MSHTGFECIMDVEVGTIGSGGCNTIKCLLEKGKIIIIEWSFTQGKAGDVHRTVEGAIRNGHYGSLGLGV